MSLFIIFSSGFKTLLKFWKSKIFKIAIFVHLSYLITSIVLFFLFLGEQNDFFIFYESSKIFLNDIENLYDQTKYLWDFRYFPLSALFFVPFTLLNFSTAFVVFLILNFFLNILIVLIMYKIIRLVKGKDHEKDDKRVILYLSLYLMAVPHLLNYIHGQINLLISFFILASLLIFIRNESIGSQLLGSLILGISVIVKPTSIFLIPFLLFIQFDLKTKRFKIKSFKSIVRLIGVLIPVSFNLILFYFFPQLWQGFLETNFTGSNASAFNFSFSITKIITNFCFFFNIPFSQLIILIITVFSIGGIGFLVFLIRKYQDYPILYGYTLGMIIMLLTYFDTWDHHLLNLLPLLIIIIFNIPRKSKLVDSIKRSLFFFNFLDIIFIGLWFLIYFIIPFNFIPTFFLFLCFYGVIRILMMKSNSSRSGDMNEK